MAETAAKKTAAKPAQAAPDHASLAAALAAFQAEMPTVHKGQTARIPGRDGRAGYSYKYADLADVAKVAHPLLARHGMAFTTRPRHLEGVGFVLEGVLRHTSGQEDVGALPITGRSAQDLGSSLTYLRRYLLGSMTGIVTDEDEDGEAATAAGTERPEPSTPPAYDASPPPLTEGQTAVNQRVMGLDAGTAGQVRDWWNQHGLPQIPALSDQQCRAIIDYLNSLEPGDPS